MTTTVKMPEPEYPAAKTIDFCGAHAPEPLFTAAQLQAYGDARMLEERERCAKVCDEHHQVRAGTGFPREAASACWCAAAIRKGAE